MVQQNYRPITLTSHITKIFERIIVKQLETHLTCKDLYNCGQHGFRVGRSCLSQLLDHHQKIISMLQNGGAAYVIYLDFAKAFDKVDHVILIRKLRSLGISGIILQWIWNFLTNRSFIVTAEGSRSKSSKVKSGVPQGTVLGPILFLIFISDIDSDTTDAKVSSFADDTRLTLQIQDDADTVKLQSDLEKIYIWAEANNMQFNEQKFEHVHYGRQCSASNYKSPDGSHIETCALVKDFGAWMSDRCDIHDHISKTISKAKKITGWAMRSFKTRKKLPMLTLLRALIIPIMEYCCQLWNPAQIGLIRQLESIQRTFTYWIDGMRDKDYWERLEALNLYSLQRRRERYEIIYTWKILNNHVPAPDQELETIISARRGLQCRVPTLQPLHSRCPTWINTAKEESLAVRGPRVFNCIPRELREYRGSPDTFKTRLDKFLREIPDKPALVNYQSMNHNRLTELVHTRA